MCVCLHTPSPLLPGSLSWKGFLILLNANNNNTTFLIPYLIMIGKGTPPSKIGLMVLGQSQIV